MRSDFDPVRSAPLPDSFERTSAWLRATPPPTPRRVSPAALVAAVVLIAACVWPVDTTVAAGSVLEVVSAERLALGHPTLAALDQIVSGDHRRVVEFESVGEEGADGTVVRYAVLGADAEAAEQWRDTVATLPSIQAARVLLLDVTRSRSFGVSTVRRVLGVHSSPRLSDRELRIEIDRVASAAGPIRLRVQRLSDGSRVVRVEDRVPLRARPSGPPALDSASARRRAGDVRAVFRLRDSLLSQPPGASFGTTLDSLPPDAERALRGQLRELIQVADSLRIRRSLERGGDPERRFLWIGTDSLPLPPGTRIDTLNTLIRIYTLPDSL